MPRKLIPNKTNCEPRKTPPPNEKIPCSWPECQGKFVSSKILEKHLKAHNEGLLECIYCKRQFQFKSQLNRHTRIHTGEKPYTCSVCPKSFSALDHLKLHTRIHTGEKPFDCKLCGTSFSSSTALQYHVRIHTGEKPYNCKLCAKSFSRPASLEVHQRIHNGDKPYKCTICSKSFSQLGNFKTHMRIHTGERPINCNSCSMSFAQQSALQYHIRTHEDKMPRARSMGRKCNISDRIQRIKKIEKSEEQTAISCKKQANRMHKQGVGRHIEGVFMGGATTTRLQTKYQAKTKQSLPLTCQVCNRVFPSPENLCRHYSLHHNLPKVVMHDLAIQKNDYLINEIGIDGKATGLC